MHVALYAIPVRTIFFTKSHGETELLERIHFAIPAFHVYCHTASCQVTPKSNKKFVFNALACIHVYIGSL